MKLTYEELQVSDSCFDLAKLILACTSYDDGFTDFSITRECIDDLIKGDMITDKEWKRCNKIKNWKGSPLQKMANRIWIAYEFNARTKLQFLAYDLRQYVDP